ncbi:MAG: OsmC family protein [Bacteroidota bacterium]|nr:OsmC family protein [Bacteroidota bacterium]
MKISSIIYLGGLRTEARHLKSGKIILTDAPPDNNGKGEAFSPTDLMAASLGSCMLTVMGIVAERHQLDISGTTVEITKIMDANPRRVVEIVVDMSFPKRDFTEKDKQLLEQTALACPVAKSLHPDLKQTVHFHW